MTPAIVELCVAMRAAEKTFTDLVAAYADRAKGTKSDAPSGTYDWTAWAPLTPSTDPDAMLGSASRGVSHQMNLSAHGRLAYARLGATITTSMLPIAENLRAHIPVLRTHPGHINLHLAMAPDGTLGRCHWNLVGYGLRRLLDGPAASCVMAEVLAFLAQEPEPNGLFRIGNKTLMANGPESVVAQHLRLCAPKTPPHQRKNPPYLPQIHRVWNSKEAGAMAKDVIASWKTKKT